uniref:Uncharacterized protein n=1 Tax=Trichogramma kaykai TaxID=54128 RepID=A0ABD2X3M3_9HYME
MQLLHLSIHFITEGNLGRLSEKDDGYIFGKRYVSFYGNVYFLGLCVVAVFFSKSRWADISERQLNNFEI